VHQIVIAFQANSAPGTRAQKGRSDVRHSPQRSPGARRHRGARSGDAPPVAQGGKIFPIRADENFSHK